MLGKSSSPEWAWCEGRLVAFSDARVPIEDRGFQFGESLYEVIAVVGGEPFRLPDHVDRMVAGARELGLEAGVPDLSKWKTIIAQLYRREPHRTAILYAQLTGGPAPRRHLPPERPRPFFAAYLRQYTFPMPTEIARGIAAITFPDTRWQRRDLKTTMLLPTVLAKKAAAAQAAEEAILVGQDGFLNEGASSTVFAVENRVVTTPPTTQRVLHGISTKAVQAICSQIGVPFAFRPLTLSDLHRSGEIFIASTTVLLMPVVRLDGSTVGSGTPGSTSLQLAYHFQCQFWGQPGP
jgi:D-alanine transaminase